MLVGAPLVKDLPDLAQLDPIQALMTNQLKLKGNMVMVMKNVKAAQEIVRACTRIDTEFPA